MKVFFLLLFFAAPGLSRGQDFAKSQEIAKQKHELILLNFSGSDWCGPCIRMRKEIFDDAAFKAMADSSLVFVNADFPRNKKNKLAATVVNQNEVLADKYNPYGKFPYTVLIDSAGRVVKAYDGLPEMTAVQFSQSLRKICDGYKR